MKHSLTPTSIRSAGITQSGGVTLIELMVTVAVLAVLLVIAAPNFMSAVASSRLTTSTNDLVSTLATARTEAIRRGTRVTVCKSSDGAQCTTAGGWTQGWIVFTDPTRSGTDAEVDTDETVLVTTASMAAGTVALGTSELADFVSYAADGRPKLMNGNTQSGRIRVCSTSASLGNGARARDIEISATGRLFTTTPASVNATCPVS